MRKRGNIAAEIPEGLKHALCALSFFRHRNDELPVYRKARTRRGRIATKEDRVNMARLARKEIGLARAAGWRGSIRQAAAEIWG